ncbi:sel1 repeat family protein [Acinetobacter wuhouensis]|nr:sel1 repeat family protein [Acinetobacter wuhouensis]RZG73234.1 sel1 repeat family protein [Acinetobacter wuhouensis]
MDLIKIIRRLRSSVIEHFHRPERAHVFNLSESMHIYHRATGYEHLALNRLYEINFDSKFNDQIHKYQRNAIWYFLHAALKGYSTAQYKLGMLYLQGQLGLDANKATAQKWLLLAANQGHVDAQNQLERLYKQ